VLKKEKIYEKILFPHYKLICIIKEVITDDWCDFSSCRTKNHFFRDKRRREGWAYFLVKYKNNFFVKNHLARIHNRWWVHTWATGASGTTGATSCTAWKIRKEEIIIWTMIKTIILKQKEETRIISIPFHFWVFLTICKKDWHQYQVQIEQTKFGR